MAANKLTNLEFAVRTTRDANQPERRPNPFHPIGIGKPLTIRLVTVYAGDYKNGVLGGKRDLLVVSQIKSLIDYYKGQRAVNQLYEKMPEKMPCRPSAKNDGTPLIYYSPAFVDDGMQVHLEFKVDRFNDKFINSLRSVLEAAGGLPVFASASGAMIAGSKLLNIAGKFANTISESQSAWLSDGIDISLELAGAFPLKEGYKLINSPGDNNEFRNFGVEVEQDNTVQLIHKESGEPYTGSKPYAILLIDGAENREFEKFSPTYASAALLEQFYGQGPNSELTVNIKDLVGLYNDHRFYHKGLETLKALQRETEGTEMYQKLETELNALLRNIQNEALRGSFKR